jgi:hypothetical protein
MLAPVNTIDIADAGVVVPGRYFIDQEVHEPGDLMPSGQRHATLARPAITMRSLGFPAEPKRLQLAAPVGFHLARRSRLTKGPFERGELPGLATSCRDARD